ncbi:MAG: DNA polymerase III subunit gamma/tau [Bacteroidetes bacterium]|nr:DNA polymerase III subunit gamma/tau [Bacteroidota bacterium]
MNPNFVDMQGYQVSARKYRPPRFDELVGQEHITTTLLNAIAKGQLAQAYLFCGPRGVGKTSCARIFAKTINCSNRDASGEACGACPTCLSFDQGGSLSIHELDAASNNSVDDIRSLVEQVRYPPQGSAFKVYIVDEVHMLSTSAFNALLKTLEEPPSYAKFILATTEKHKILPTILSRCQIFDFKRIRPQDIADRLALVCKAEKITYDTEALLTIAGRSDGALRDALTMLDQLAGYGGGHLGQTLVAEQLGVLNQQGFLDATETLQKGDPGPTLQLLGTLIARGYDPIQWVLGMAVHLRNLLMAKAPGTLDLIESGPEFKEKLQQQALRSDTGFLLGALHLLNQVELQYRQARQPRLLVETALFKIGYLANRQLQASLSPPTSGSSNPGLHPLAGISDKVPAPSDFKTPAKVRVQAPPVEIPKPVEISAPLEIPPPVDTAAPAEHPTFLVASTTTLPPATIETPANEGLAQPSTQRKAASDPLGQDFLKQIKKHLAPKEGSKNPGIDESQQWDPPTLDSQGNLEACWSALLEQCQQRGLGALEGLLARNKPQNPEPQGSGALQLDVILYSDTEKTLFDREKSNILGYLRTFGPPSYRLEWNIIQQNLGQQREKYLTEQERFQRLLTENENFIDLSSRIGLNLI